MTGERQPSLPVPLKRDGAPALRGGLPMVEPGFGRPGEMVQYEPLIDANAFFAAIRRNWKLIAAIIVGCLLLALLVTALMPRTYQATARIQIGEEVASPIDGIGNERVREPRQEDVRALQTQVDLLQTRGLATAVQRRLASDPATADIARELTPRRIQKSLEVTAPRASRIVPLDVYSQDPRAAAAIANSYAELLIDYSLRTRLEASASTRDFLQREMNQSKGKLENSERALLAYARSAGLIDASNAVDPSISGSSSGVRSLTTSNLVQINEAVATAQTARLQAEQRWQQAQATPVMSLPEVLNNSAIQRLTQQRAEVQARLEENRQRYTEEHPLVQQSAANIAELDRQISSIANSVRNSLRDQYLTARRQESALRGSLGALKGRTLSEQDRSVRYNTLRREVETNRQLYEGLLSRFKTVSAEQGGITNNITVVDRAVTPTSPVSPNPFLNLALGGMGGLVLSFLVVFVRQRADNTIHDPELVDRDITVALLGVIPRIRGDKSVLEALLEPRSPYYEACHTLRAALELGTEAAGARSLFFTSSKSQEGKTSTAIGLAHVASEAGRRVLLIDADLRKPSIHGLLDIDKGDGFSDLLAGNVQLNRAVRRVDRFGFDVLTAGNRTDSPAALLQPERVQEIIAEAESHYDLVVIDGPPAMGIADSVLLASSADATVFVVGSERVTRDEAQLALRRLRTEHANIVGAVLNGYEAGGSALAYHYSYHYGTD